MFIYLFIFGPINIPSPKRIFISHHISYPIFCDYYCNIGEVARCFSVVFISNTFYAVTHTHMEPNGKLGHGDILFFLKKLNGGGEKRLGRHRYTSPLPFFVYFYGFPYTFIIFSFDVVVCLREAKSSWIHLL